MATATVRRAPAVADRCRAAVRLRAIPALAVRLRAIPALAVLLATLVLAAALWAILQRAEPHLGHDESVYAGRARSWVTGTPAVGWMVYRPVGLPLLGAAALRLHSGAGTLRLLGLLLALMTLLVVFFVGSRVTTSRRSAVTVLVVVSGATFLRRLPEFLDDIPAAGLLLLTAYLVLRSRRPRGWWALPAAAVTGVLAVLVRYGAAAGLITIAAAAVTVWGPRAWLRAWREVGAASALAAAGLASLAWYSQQETGSMIGLWLRAATTAHRAFVGEGLAYYVRALPAKLAGPLGAVVILAALAGLVATGRQLARSRHRSGSGSGSGSSSRVRTTDSVSRVTSAERDQNPDRAPDGELARARERLFLGLAALGELLLLGVVAHGESRFALFAVITLTVLGVDALARAAGRRRQTVLAAIAATAVLVTGVTTVLVYRQIVTVTARVDAVATAASHLPTTSSGGLTTSDGAAVPAPATGHPCLVITRLAIEAAWASGCNAVDPADLVSLPPDARVYVLEFPQTPGWSALPRVRSLAPERTWTVRPVASSGQLGEALVALSPPVATRAPVRASTPATNNPTSARTSNS